MKLRTKFILGTALSIMLMGGAYATWSDGFNVMTEIKTYEFDVEVDGVAIDDELKVEKTIQLSEKNPNIKIVNIGTVPITIKKLKVEYTTNVGNVNLLQEIEYGTMGDIQFNGSTLVSSDLGYLEFDSFGSKYKIEPESNGSNEFDFKLIRKQTRDDMLQSYKDKVDEKQVLVDNFKLNEDKSNASTLAGYKTSLKEATRTLIQRTSAYDNDKLKLTFYFEMKID